jgi:archaemetzincin
MHQGQPTDDTLPDLERRLRPLAAPLGAPEPGDWLSENHEKGQTFRQYLSANPVHRDRERNTLYLCLVGGFIEAQQRIVERTREYLQLFFDVPVHVRRRLPLSEIPAHARRTHPDWGDKQILSTFILREILEPDRPDDALAYLALTARDLWLGEGWNFVFGEANLRRRVGLLSLYRLGYPGPGEEAIRLCLRRTLQTASHETGHMLTMRHCTAFACLMNGCNHCAEQDRQPLHPCPVCLRKLLWNLSVEPISWLWRLGAFVADQGLEDALWFVRAATALEEWRTSPGSESRGRLHAQ